MAWFSVTFETEMQVTPRSKELFFTLNNTNLSLKSLGQLRRPCENYCPCYVYICQLVQTLCMILSEATTNVPKVF